MYSVPQVARGGLLESRRPLVVALAFSVRVQMDRMGRRYP